MKRLAVFVEGYTEQQFVERLIIEIATENNVRIEKRKIRGGTTTRRSMKLIEAIKPDEGQKYYVLLVDCGGDDAVKSRIIEEYDNLASKEYALIIGLRDVRPIARADIPRLEAGLPLCVKTKPIRVIFILSVMEIEAWFLAEHSHFLQIDPTLTVAYITTNMKFDPAAEDMQLRDKPADDMNQIYALVGQTYTKHTAKTTIDALSFEVVYCDLPARFPYLDKFIAELNSFFS
ncbi:MAG: hypothetical protein L0Z62_06785 [Gemmataceae bacterium]|nr:hypothetical protein [Gemmataceae bacterium]